jgi:DNA-binding beta-propeller fold protein YncE
VTENAILAVASSPCKVMDFFLTNTGDHIGRVHDLLPEPHELAPDPGRRLIYVAHTYRQGGYDAGEEPAHEISVVDADALLVRDVIDISPYISPHDIEYCAASDIIYASVESNSAGNGVVLIDASSRRILGHIATPGRNSHWLSVTPDGARAFVSHKEGTVLSVLDLPRRALLDTIPVGGGAEEVDCSADGRWVYVVTPLQTRPAPTRTDSARLLKIDSHTLKITGELELEPTVVAVRAAAGDRVLVSQMYPTATGDAIRTMYSGVGQEHVPGKLLVIDSASMSIVHSVIVDRMAFTIRVSADGSTAYVANLGAGTVSVIDLNAGCINGTLMCTPDERHGGTHGLALLPATDAFGQARPLAPKM